ncbi:hypothetical protein SAMN04515647_2761 [Cohaesibacter sp. ES.047]|uniref:GNAT family acetyltransferase n=1 Tax=Cohaesibacter sp. ES.047 TaxID=1798205 RepID=UPI000BB7948E|nr:GNAT family acetyltransferase [Cohaesibacter sp. ES.047]SNY92488.1 hypothetical protein SAMN04515647_2761 [Cohaesibacter sp. ES.047]
MSDLIISEIEDTDVTDVIALWQACNLTRPWNDPNNDIAVARSSSSSTILVGRLEPNGQILASIMAGFDGHRGWVYYLSVSPNHQGKGFGRQIMKAAEQWLLSMGGWKMQLMVRTGNEPVQAFYESLGYNVSPTQVLEKWIDPSRRGDQ